MPVGVMCSSHASSLATRDLSLTVSRVLSSVSLNGCPGQWICPNRDVKLPLPDMCLRERGHHGWV